MNASTIIDRVVKVDKVEWIFLKDAQTAVNALRNKEIDYIDQPSYEQVGDLNVDYIQPLRYGRFETGLKLRKRYIPTNMQFFPGLNSPLQWAPSY